MGRFYECRSAKGGDGEHYLVTVAVNAYEVREVEVPREVFELLEELQREHWRLERRESRHSWHIEDMRESDLPHIRHVATPEQLLLQHIDDSILRRVLIGLPEIQRRRFLLHHLWDLPIKAVARMEGCSDRAGEVQLSPCEEEPTRDAGGERGLRSIGLYVQRYRCRHPWHRLW